MRSPRSINWYCQINNEKPRWNSVDIRVLRRGESFITSSLLISGVSADGV